MNSADALKSSSAENPESNRSNRLGFVNKSSSWFSLSHKTSSLNFVKDSERFFPLVLRFLYLLSEGVCSLPQSLSIEMSWVSSVGELQDLIGDSSPNISPNESLLFWVALFTTWSSALRVSSGVRGGGEKFKWAPNDSLGMLSSHSGLSGWFMNSLRRRTEISIMVRLLWLEVFR